MPISKVEAEDKAVNRRERALKKVYAKIDSILEEDRGRGAISCITTNVLEAIAGDEWATSFIPQIMATYSTLALGWSVKVGSDCESTYITFS